MDAVAKKISATKGGDHTRMTVEKNGKYYMLNEACEKVTEDSYEGADIFRGGSLAAVKIDGKWGFINEKREVVIPLKYDFVQSFSDMRQSSIIRLITR